MGAGLHPAKPKTTHRVPDEFEEGGSAFMRSARHLTLLALLALLATFAPPAKSTLAATVTVINTNDSGAGSLRQAILDANAAAAGTPMTVSFAIPTSDPGFNAAGYWTISPAKPLPALTHGITTIDATTQPNGRATGPKIFLDGTVTLDPANGNMRNSHGLVITSGSNIIKGLGINNFVRAIGLTEDVGGAGIYIAGASATNNQVLGCYLGITPDGTTAAGNGDWGVLIDDGASTNQIGGTGTTDRNVIAGNGQADVGVTQVKANSTRSISGNVILGNYIGTNATGTAAIGGAGNPGHGVVLGSRAQGSIVGGTAAGAGNVIAGHNRSTPFLSYTGVNVASQATGMNNTIIGNFIGTNASGTAAISNVIGVRVSGSTNTTIGGATAASRNIISGNSGAGVQVTLALSTNATILGNWIGLSASGGALGNRQEGVRIDTGASATTVGPGNVISANGATGSADGVRILNSSTHHNTVIGNFIGTDPTGLTTSTALVNTRSSIRIEDSHDNRVGGTLATERNVIAVRDDQIGVAVTSSANLNTVLGNYIGVNASGNAILSGPGVGVRYGIRIDNSATNTTIGDSAAGGRNVIAGLEIGVSVNGSTSTNTLILGNTIGAGASGQVLGNTQYGMLIDGGATTTTIGGANAGEGNLVTGSQIDGILISGASTNSVIGNRLVNNTANGIKVSGSTNVLISKSETSGNGGDGIALTSGGNGGLTAPSGLQLTGTTLSGGTCANCTVEVFTSQTREDGEGPRYLTSTTANAAGSFSVNLSACDAFITATARSANGNTSPFAPMISTCHSSQADVQLSTGTPLSSAGTPINASPGDVITFVHTLTNIGDLAGTFTITRTSTRGWATLPSITSVPLNPSESRTIAITVSVPLNAPVGTLDQTTLTAAVGARSQAQSNYTQLQQRYSLTIMPDRVGTVISSTTQPVWIDYTHIITNTGNGNDTIQLSAVSSASSASTSFPDGTTCGLAAGAACTRRVRVTIAAGSTDSLDTTTVTATSSGGPTAQVHDTTTIAHGAMPQISPNQASFIVQQPPATVVFTHTVTNIGLVSDMFTLGFQGDAPFDWSAALSTPTSFQLAPNESRQVLLTVFVPSTALADDTSTFTITVSTAEASASATDQVTIAVHPGVAFTSNRQSIAAPGTTIDYTHVITNTGNATDNFTITLTPDLGWQAIATPEIVTLPPGGSQIVTITVAPPTGVLFGKRGIVRATATSSFQPNPSASILETTVIAPAFGAELLPAEQRITANEIVTDVTQITVTQILTHTLRNSGSITGTFTLTFTTDSPAWTTILTSTVVGPLAPGETAPIILSVTVPISIPYGAHQQTRLEVQEQSKPDATLAFGYDNVYVGIAFWVNMPLLASTANAPPLTTREQAPGQAYIRRRSYVIITI